jgi:hypothetical protein
MKPALLYSSSLNKKRYDDQGPGTSTEEEFLLDDAEEDVIAQEQRRLDSIKKLKKKTPTGAYVRSSILFKLVRWPLLIIVLGIICWDLCCYFLIRQWVSWTEFMFIFGKKKTLLKKLQQSNSYSEWKTAALQLDAFLGLNTWKSEPFSPFYDAHLLQKIVLRLKRYRLKFKSVKDVCKILKHSSCKNNVGGVNTERLYSFTYFGSKKLIDEYVEESVQSLDFVAQHSQLREKQSFFKHLSKNYGRSALCLSGGAGLAYYHLGVVKALFENHLLPTVITGASAGSLVAALICTRTDEEIKNEVFDLNVLQPRLCALSDTWKVFILNIYFEIFWVNIFPDTYHSLSEYRSYV